MHLAAPLFFGLLAPVGALSQAPVRIRDASFAMVRYEDGSTAGALTLYDAVIVATERSSRAGIGVLSIFSDGRFSAQGGLEFGTAFVGDAGGPATLSIAHRGSR